MNSSSKSEYSKGFKTRRKQWPCKQNPQIHHNPQQEREQKQPPQIWMATNHHMEGKLFTRKERPIFIRNERPTFARKERSKDKIRNEKGKIYLQEENFHFFVLVDNQLHNGCRLKTATFRYFTACSHWERRGHVHDKSCCRPQFVVVSANLWLIISSSSFFWRNNSINNRTIIFKDNNIGVVENLSPK